MGRESRKPFSAIRCMSGRLVVVIGYGGEKRRLEKPTSPRKWVRGRTVSSTIPGLSWDAKKELLI